jgi:hypothetical protein
MSRTFINNGEMSKIVFGILEGKRPLERPRHR